MKEISEKKWELPEAMKMPVPNSKSRDRDHLRLYIGFAYFLTAMLALSTVWTCAVYLNQFTISLHVTCYIYWVFLVMKLHQKAHLEEKKYPYGPRESAVGAIIPFSYIFWNFFWVEKMTQRFSPDKNRPYAPATLGILCAAASLICFPDNMERMPIWLQLSSFLMLFSIIAYLSKRIGTTDGLYPERLIRDPNYTDENPAKIKIAGRR
ncbi:MAG: hypothetical protein K8F91_20550 [Candidatus Obscuribacterales bacterium]|nr:hypothetical protein [Candidatus Obscuribacterales bacterium]